MKWVGWQRNGTPASYHAGAAGGHAAIGLCLGNEPPVAEWFYELETFPTLSFLMASVVWFPMRVA